MGQIASTLRIYNMIFCYTCLGWLSYIEIMLDAAAALKVMFSTMNSPSQLGWPADGDDPCGQSWKGISCVGNRVSEM